MDSGKWHTVCTMLSGTAPNSHPDIYGNKMTVVTEKISYTVCTKIIHAQFHCNFLAYSKQTIENMQKFVIKLEKKSHYSNPETLTSI